MIDRRFKQVGGLGRPLGGEGAPELGAEVDLVDGVLVLERGEPARWMGGQARAPLVGRQVERVRRQRMIGAARFVRIDPRLERVLDHRQALVAGGVSEVVERDQRVGGQIVEQGLELGIEQRQEVLHAAPPAALVDCGVQGILGGGAERRAIGLTEAGDRVLVEKNLRDRHELDRSEAPGRALRHRVEGADSLEHVAEQVEADRLLRAWREDVDHPAADGELAALGNGRGALVAVDGEVAFEAREIDLPARLGGITGLGQDRARRHALHQGRRWRDKNARALAPALGQPRQRSHTARGDARGRAHAVVGQAVPGGEADQLDIGGEEVEGVGERLGACPIAGDEDGQATPRASHVGDRQRIEAFGRAGELERAGRGRHAAEVRALALDQAHRWSAPLTSKARIWSSRPASMNCGVGAFSMSQSHTS